MPETFDISILDQCELTRGITPLLTEELVKTSLTALIQETCRRVNIYLRIKINHVGHGINGSERLGSARESLIQKRNELLRILQ